MQTQGIVKNWTIQIQDRRPLSRSQMTTGKGATNVLEDKEPPPAPRLMYEWGQDLTLGEGDNSAASLNPRGSESVFNRQVVK